MDSCLFTISHYYDSLAAQNLYYPGTPCSRNHPKYFYQYLRPISIDLILQMIVSLATRSLDYLLFCTNISKLTKVSVRKNLKRTLCKRCSLRSGNLSASQLMPKLMKPKNGIKLADNFLWLSSFAYYFHFSSSFVV